MKVYIVTVQGRFIDVFTEEKSATDLKQSLYMAGNDGISIIHKII